MNEELVPIVVIGGGISGVSCIEVLAQHFTDRPLVLISASDIIKVVSNVRRIGQTIDDLDVREESNHYLVNKYKNIDIIINELIQLNASEHLLTLRSGQTVKYDKLCLCLGAKPKVIPLFDSLSVKTRNSLSDNILVIRDTQSVDYFEKRLKNAKRIVIVGNGGIATELVHQISDCQMIWCIKDDSLGAPYFDPMAAKFFTNQLNVSPNESKAFETKILKRLKYSVFNTNFGTNGQTFGTALGPDWSQSRPMSGADTKTIKIELNCELINIYKYFDEIQDSKKPFIHSNEPEVWPLWVELTNGSIYGCDFIVSATGVVPNTDVLLNGNHFTIGTDGGLLINNEMKTSEADVYAAGDVCCVGWDTAQHWFQMRLWTQARQMGVYAAQCIAANLNQTSAHLFFNFDLFAHMTRFFDYKVVLLGLYNGQKVDSCECRTLVRVVPNQQFVKVILKDDKMIGAILVGETDLEETFENLILNQIDLSAFGDQLLDNTVDLEDYFD